ncbi:hypothetical protein E8F20_09705 [Pseudomonas sp. BN415]|uniref:hypothetical protein n=1 Tax=Pseudomonas sp. BN415 TaxID=2567889 RepID=UPI002454397F|nr:hypothetical protein [Pseudomonas sp. BN415]MDH4582142.1 hypothetical protein [Pseudomonas sp. BN415]
MSSFDISGVRSGLSHYLEDRPGTRYSRFTVLGRLAACFSGIASSTLIVGGLLGPPGLVLSDASADVFEPLASMSEVQRNALDAAEQRNAEDSPSSIARHPSLELTG